MIMKPILGLAAIIAARFWWEVHPGIIPCAAFWTVAISFFGRLWINDRGALQVARSIMMLGFLSNAAATLANGGYMPVLGRSEPSGSVWIPLTEATRLPALCDRYAAGASIGDFAIALGMVIGVAIEIMRIVSERPKPGVEADPCRAASH